MDDMMKICASSVCWGGDSRQDVYKKTAGAGFDALELLIMPPETASFHNHSLRTVTAAALINEFKQYGLKCAGLHIGGISTDSKLDARIEYAHTAIDAAAEIGCSLLVVNGPDRASERFKPYILAIESLIPHLEQKSVKIALENHMGNWIQYIQDYEFIFDFIDSPMLGITLDTGHFTGSKVDPEDVARRFSSKIFHVHVKDHVGTESVEMGMGTTNNRGCVRALREAGYAGYLSQELEVASAIADRAAAEGYNYMRILARQ